MGIKIKQLKEVDVEIELPIYFKTSESSGYTAVFEDKAIYVADDAIVILSNIKYTLESYKAENEISRAEFEEKFYAAKERINNIQI